LHETTARRQNLQTSLSGCLRGMLEASACQQVSFAAKLPQRICK